MSDLFKNDQNVDENNYDDVGDIGETDYQSQLVGEGKKFKDVNALAKGKMQSDVFIQQLIAEKRKLQDDLNSRQSVEEIFNKMRQESPASNQGAENREPEKTDTLKPEDINRLVSEAVESKTKAQREDENLASVMKTLSETFGPNFQNVLRERVQDLGVGEDFATGLAKSNPKAFLKLIGEPPKQPDLFTPPRSEVRPSTGGSGEKRNYAYFEKMRKSDPDRYRASQSEMVKLAIQMGDDFYS